MQAAYDGAALVYAREQAIGYMQKPYVPGYAKVATFTTDGTNLNTFVHHIGKAEDNTLEYHQYPIKSMNLFDSYEGFCEGRRHLRNTQDLAKEESTRFRDELKDYWKARGSQPVALPTEDDYEVVELKHPPDYQPTPPTSSKPKHGKASSRSSHSSKAPPPAHDYAPSSGHKRKASHSPSSTSSKHNGKYQSYWKKDAKSGRYYHKHSDGAVIWLHDDDDGDY